MQLLFCSNRALQQQIFLQLLCRLLSEVIGLLLGIAIDIFQSNRIRLLDDTFRLFFSLPIGKLLQQFLPFLLDLPGNLPDDDIIGKKPYGLFLGIECGKIRILGRNILVCGLICLLDLFVDFSHYNRVAISLSKVWGRGAVEELSFFCLASSN